MLHTFTHSVFSGSSLVNVILHQPILIFIYICVYLLYMLHRQGFSLRFIKCYQHHWILNFLYTALCTLPSLCVLSYTYRLYIFCCIFLCVFLYVYIVTHGMYQSISVYGHVTTSCDLYACIYLRWHCAIITWVWWRAGVLETSPWCNKV